MGHAGGGPICSLFQLSEYYCNPIPRRSIHKMKHRDELPLATPVGSARTVVSQACAQDRMRLRGPNPSCPIFGRLYTISSGRVRFAAQYGGFDGVVGGLSFGPRVRRTAIRWSVKRIGSHVQLDH